jgi:hypothetical protein
VLMSETTRQQSDAAAGMTDSHVIYLLYRRVDSIATIIKVWFGLTLVVMVFVVLSFIAASL